MSEEAQRSGERMTWQERWVGTPEWDLAKRLHQLLCTKGHQMDQCWGMADPWSLNQPEMPYDFRNWLSRALRLVEMRGSVEAASEYLDGPDDPREQHPLWGPWTVPPAEHFDRIDAPGDES